MEETFKLTLQSWIQDIYLMDATTFNRTSLLCYFHNYCTRPGALRTDEEHRILSRCARWARRQLGGRTGWHESDNGHYRAFPPARVVTYCNARQAFDKARCVNGIVSA